MWKTKKKVIEYIPILSIAGYHKKKLSRCWLNSIQDLRKITYQGGISHSLPERVSSFAKFYLPYQLSR